MKIISIQNLVAIDKAIHGRKIILLEFFGAVLFCLGLGLYILISGKNASTLWIGFGILGIGFNYVPLLIYSVSKKSNLPPNSELLSVDSKRRYTKQSLFLIVPFLVSIIAFIQALKRTG